MTRGLSGIYQPKDAQRLSEAITLVKGYDLDYHHTKILHSIT